MNRHRRLALLAPALAASVALAPAVWAPGATAVAAAPTGASCALVRTEPGMQDEDTRFALRLTGFPPGQEVVVDGPTDFRARVDAKGAFEEDSVVYGPYRVGFREPGADPRIIRCTAPPGQAAG
ncbi:hypothetical protein [Streptomyces sp. NPDC002054]|uniref:hypothetical protein n=1 Tax=Streptomyces sp. NPDC002054 TaxID=3154663 RepID=UPI0033322B7B